MQRSKQLLRSHDSKNGSRQDSDKPMSQNLTIMTSMRGGGSAHGEYGGMALSNSSQKRVAFKSLREGSTRQDDNHSEVSQVYLKASKTSKAQKDQYHKYLDSNNHKIYKKSFKMP